MLKLLAHATENHNSNTDGLLHLLEVWYSSIPIYLVTTFLLVTLVHTLFKKSINTTFVFLAFWLLTSGVFLYDRLPIISAISIVSGLVISAIFALAGLVKK